MAKIEFSVPHSRSEAGLLAALWRKIIQEAGLFNSLNTLVDNYIRENDKTEGRVQAVKIKTRATLNNNISASEMTIKTFIDLLFSLLKVRRVKLSVELTHNSGRVTSHSITTVSKSQQENIGGEDGTKE